MNKLLGIFLAAIVLIGSAYFLARPSVILPSTEETLTHFIEATTERVTALDGYAKMGLGGGVDGFTLRMAYPNLIPSDFANVQAYQGYYFEQDGQLFYSGNAASNSSVMLREGMRTLLENLSRRLSISPHTDTGVDKILEKLGE
jgi:hypothetical protein